MGFSDIIGDAIGDEDPRLSAMMDLAAEAGADDDDDDETGDDIIGARRRRRMPKGARSAFLMKRPLVRRRVFPLGMNSTGTVAAGSNATITTRPQVPYKATHLYIPSDIAGSFDVVDVKVGQQSQLVAAGNLPGRMFEEKSVGANLVCDTATVGTDISLIVQNLSAGALAFKAGFLGVALLP